MDPAACNGTDFQWIRSFIVVVSVSSNILLMEEIVHHLIGS